MFITKVSNIHGYKIVISKPFFTFDDYTRWLRIYDKADRYYGEIEIELPVTGSNRDTLEICIVEDHPDGQYLICRSKPKRLTVISLTEKIKITSYDLVDDDFEVQQYHLSPDKRYLAIKGETQGRSEVKIYDIQRITSLPWPEIATLSAQRFISWIDNKTVSLSNSYNFSISHGRQESDLTQDELMTLYDLEDEGYPRDSLWEKRENVFFWRCNDAYNLTKDYIINELGWRRSSREPPPKSVVININKLLDRIPEEELPLFEKETQVRSLMSWLDGVKAR